MKKSGTVMVSLDDLVEEDGDSLFGVDDQDDDANAMAYLFAGGFVHV